MISAHNTVRSDDLPGLPAGLFLPGRIFCSIVNVMFAGLKFYPAFGRSFLSLILQRQGRFLQVEAADIQKRLTH